MGSLIGSALANIFMYSLKINGSKIALMVSSLSAIDGIVMTYLHYFSLLIMQKSLKIIYLPNILTLHFYWKKKIMVVIFFRHEFISGKRKVCH